MKTNALLAFFFFSVALFASTKAAYVRDSEGHLVTNGGTYYLMPQELTGAAILGVSVKNPEGSCSLAVVEKSLNNNGNATIVQSNLRADYITTEQPVGISFNPLPSNDCTKRSVWVVAMDADFGQTAVMVGDASEFPNPISGRFYFKTDDSARYIYRLVYYFDQQSCGRVAVKTDGYENRRLIVATKPESEGPLTFKLVKASGDRFTSHISMVI